MKTIPIVAESAETEQLMEHELYHTPEKDVLVLNYTLACPLSCDFCCYGCHPQRKEKMPLDAAKDLLTQASRMPNFSSVGLTGGEVFMFEDELISLAEHMKECHLPFTVATAAHWATSPEKARSLARVLVSNGLKRANISCDHSHAAFISPEYVALAANAFAELDVPVYIVGTFADESGSLEHLVPQLIRKKNIYLRTKRIAKVGRATKQQVNYEDVELDANMTCYRPRHHDLVVFWDGQVYPCCSTFNRATKGLSVGNAFETPLAEIWSRVEYSSLFRLMKSTGFVKILEIIASHDEAFASTLPKMTAYPGACSYCNTVFSDSHNTNRIRRIFAEYETNKIFAARSELTKLLGEDKVAQLFKQYLSSAAGAHSI